MTELIMNRFTVHINPHVAQKCESCGFVLDKGEPTIGESNYCLPCWEDTAGYPMSDWEKAVIRANVLTSYIKAHEQEILEFADELSQLSKDYDLRGYAKLPQDYQVTMEETNVEPVVKVAAVDVLSESFLWPVYDPAPEDGE